MSSQAVESAPLAGHLDWWVGEAPHRRGQHLTATGEYKVLGQEHALRMVKHHYTFHDVEGEEQHRTAHYARISRR